MNRILLFAAASVVAVGVAPASHAEERVHLVGGCPTIASGGGCPAAPQGPPPPPGGYPLGAQPGQCFAQVRTPPVYDTYSEQVVVSPGHPDRRFVPAQYDWSEHQILVVPAREERRVIPATYRTLTETIVVQAATVHVEQIPPVYDTVTERVMVRQAHSEWRRTYVGPNGVLPPGARVEATGEVVCLVEIPAEFTTVSHQVVRIPGHTVETPVAAVTREVSRQVVDQAERVTFDHIPAVYRTEKTRHLVSPAHWERTDVPPVFANRTKQRLVSSGGLEWRQVDCDTKGQPIGPAQHP